MTTIASPTVSDEALITLQLELRAEPVGTTPFGTRREVFFGGSATAPTLWPGTRRVTGVDHITVGSNGLVRIDVHVVITDGDEVLTYRGHGRSGGVGVVEGVTFDTGSERLAWLNERLAVGRAVVDGSRLDVALFLVEP